MNKKYYVLLDAAGQLGEIRDMGSYEINGSKEIYAEGVTGDGVEFELRLKLKKEEKEVPENGD